MSETTGIPPPAKWGQNTSVVYLTFTIECTEPKYEFTEDSLKFSGVGIPENKFYDVNITFFGKIKKEEIIAKSNRCVEFVIPKAESGNWTYLTADKKKYHWLSVDFAKTHLDSDSEDEGGKGNGSYEHLINNLGSISNDKPTFDDLDDEKDSDDDEMSMPNLSSD